MPLDGAYAENRRSAMSPMHQPRLGIVAHTIVTDLTTLSDLTPDKLAGPA
jgi:hypothetical protein